MTVYVACWFGYDISHLVAVRRTFEGAVKACAEASPQLLGEFVGITVPDDESIWRATEAGKDMNFDNGYFIYAMPVGDV